MTDKMKYVNYWIVEPTKRGGIKKRIESGSHINMLKVLGKLKSKHPEYRIFEMVSYFSKDVTEARLQKFAEIANSVG